MKVKLTGGLVAFVAATCYGGPIVIGAPTTQGNCFPFGCAWGTRYQQVYDASSFPAAINIGTIIFYADAYRGDDNLLSNGVFELYLSTTSRAVNTIDNFPFDTNLGSDNTLFATVTGPFVIPDVWQITGGPFYYNPAAGNLLLDVRVAYPAGRQDGYLYLNARNGDAGGLFSRAHNFGTAFDDWGLVTGFDGPQAPPGPPGIPEPGTLGLLGLGACFLAGLRWRARAS